MTGAELFESAMDWLQAHYGDYRFYTERDVVWTVQQHLAQRLTDEGLPCHVFHDYPMLPGSSRTLCADVAVLAEPMTLPALSSTGKWGPSMAATVAVEFKYEPAHMRWGRDIWPTKGWVVDWAEVRKDVARITEFVDTGRAEVAFAVFVDEGRAFRHRAPLSPGAWRDWTNGVSVHWTRVEAPRT